MALVGLLGAGAATGWMPLELLPSQRSYLLLNSRQDSWKEIKQTAQGEDEPFFSGSPNVRKR